MAALGCWRISRRLVYGIVLAWAAVGLVAGLAIPPVDPTLSVVRPLETLSTILVTLPVTLQCAALVTRTPWLAVTAARDLRVLRLAWVGVVLATGALACTLTCRVANLPVEKMVLVWAYASAVGLITLVLAGATAAAITPFVAIAGFSIGHGIPPWEWNLLYNPAHQGLLTGVAVVGLIAGCALYALRGDHDCVRATR